MWIISKANNCFHEENKIIWFEFSRRTWSGRDSRLARGQHGVRTTIGEKPWVTMEIRQQPSQCKHFLGFTGAIIQETGNNSHQKITGFAHKVRLLWKNYQKWERRENSTSYFISLLLVNKYLLRFSICQKLVEILHWINHCPCIHEACNLARRKGKWTKLMRFSKKPFKL